MIRLKVIDPMDELAECNTELQESRYSEEISGFGILRIRWWLRAFGSRWKN
jgi:hypothetical protein